MLLIEEVDYLEDVYDITVEDNNNFFGNDILVHNCTEITLFSDDEHTYTCVLSSLNLAKYDEWKDTDTIFVSSVFLDCVASEFISIGKKIKGLEKAVRFTEKSRALGLGVMGFHTYLQLNMIPFESIEAHFKNAEIFKKIKEESEKATRWMAEAFGEPEWCRGYNRRNSHLLAVAPTLSTAGIMGGVSQGIEPVYKNVYVQGSAAGEMNRINPVFLELLKEKGIYDDKHINEVINLNGSVQDVEWLNEEEKKVFKTAFEIDQKVIVRLASVRQQFIDQAQSINLFFSSDESEEYISEVHQMAFNDPLIKSLYYIRSESGVQASKGECESCAG
jgi:ribonucleoside-diphosphate reductase alpha chain